MLATRITRESRKASLWSYFSVNFVIGDYAGIPGRPDEFAPRTRASEWLCSVLVLHARTVLLAAQFALRHGF